MNNSAFRYYVVMDNTNSSPRQDYLSWDESFMALACLIKERSKDPSTQVGACIVDSDNRILSLGYNGAPNGFEDKDFPWGKEGDTLDTKYPYVVHAERNAVLNFRGSLREFEGATVYVTHFPCNECAKELVQSGIARVVYLNEKDNGGLTEASVRILEAKGVELEHFPIGNFSITVNK